jgi:hypothetical protein
MGFHEKLSALESNSSRKVSGATIMDIQSTIAQNIFLRSEKANENINYEVGMFRERDPVIEICSSKGSQGYALHENNKTLHNIVVQIVEASGGVFFL